MVRKGRKRHKSRMGLFACGESFESHRFHGLHRFISLRLKGGSPAANLECHTEITERGLIPRGLTEVDVRWKMLDVRCNSMLDVFFRLVSCIDGLRLLLVLRSRCRLIGSVCRRCNCCGVTFLSSRDSPLLLLRL